MKAPAVARHPDAAPCVDVRDVWVRFNSKWVLKGIHLACHAGEILGIVGPNGGGKSTLLRVILGLVRPTKGSVTLFGQKPGSRSRREVGYLPQISHAERSFPVSVLDVVLMGLYRKLGFFHRPDPRSRQTAMELLQQVGMAPQAGLPFGNLSGGQQQRVQIARALAARPRLLVLDEPSTGIDSVAQEDFYELLGRLRDAQGLSVVMVSHDIGVISAYTDRVACLNRQIHFHGEPDFCLDPDVRRRTFGQDFKVMVHDAHCATCFRKHAEDDDPA